MMLFQPNWTAEQMSIYHHLKHQLWVHSECSQLTTFSLMSMNQHHWHWNCLHLKRQINMCEFRFDLDILFLLSIPLKCWSTAWHMNFSVFFFTANFSMPITAFGLASKQKWSSRMVQWCFDHVAMPFQWLMRNLSARAMMNKKVQLPSDLHWTNQNWWLKMTDQTVGVQEGHIQQKKPTNCSCKNKIERPKTWSTISKPANKSVIS